MSLELAQKSLQLFDGDLELGQNSSRIQKPSKSEKVRIKKRKKDLKWQKEDEDKDQRIERRAEELMRASIIGKLKTPKILDKVVKQQLGRQSYATHRLQQKRRRMSSSASSVKVAAPLVVEGKDQNKSQSKEENKATKNKGATESESVFTEEDFQKFFKTYNPVKKN
jgi:hypothetical protein